MWIIKDSKSKYFFDPEDLRIFFETVTTQSMDTASPDLASSAEALPAPPNSTSTAAGSRRHSDNGKWGRNKDSDRTTRLQEGRDMALQAVSNITHDSSRDKSRSPLKSAASDYGLAAATLQYPPTGMGAA